jgi:hypothetical protein
MEYNLLQKYYDKQCELFIKGFIDWQQFEELETDYFRKYKLFIINLN